MIKNIFTEYYDAKLAVQAAEDRVKALKEELVAELLKVDGNKVDLPEARIALRTNVVYKFSPAIAKQEEKIKKIQDSIKDKVELNTELLKTMRETEINEGKAQEVSKTFIPVVSPIKEK